MSGDVQPRKRKDKKRKREDEEIREHHHGVHATKMGTDDIHLHIQGDTSTGGHWCAKVFFFSLLAILFGLIGLIILENRGLSDLDTPLSESRFSEYFNGWVDEHRHDDHVDKVMEAIKKHDHDAEPFDEEENNSEQDEGQDDHDEENEVDEEYDEGENEVEENEVEENEVEENEVEENEVEENEEQEDNDQSDGEGEDEENEFDEDDDEQNESDPEKDENDSAGDDEVEEQTTENVDDVDEGFEDAEPDDDDEDDNESVPAQDTEKQSYSAHDPFDEEDDFDDDDESLEQVVDNDAGEFLHLQEKAKQEEENSKINDPIPEEESEGATQVKRGSQSMNEDSFIDDELNRASDEMLQNNLKSALNICESILLKHPKHPGALFGKAKVLDRLSQKYMSNEMLKEAISIYVNILRMELNDDDFKEAAERCIDRMRFIGLHLKAIPIHKLLIKRFKDVPQYRNELAVTLLLINRLSEAKYILHRTLLKWRNDGFAQVHYGFILKNLDQDLEGAVKFLQQGIDSEAKGTQDGRFYFNLGDALQRLGRKQEAIEIYRKGAKKELFLSEYQRSLYNIRDLKGQPFWTKHETTYADFFNIFERNWKNIRNEGLNVLNEKGYFKNEVENLKDTGDWKQFELYTRGSIISKNCLKTPLTCKLIQTFPAARTCKRGQIKFSVIHSGTHVWPHCGPTNCRLRAHLGLKLPSGTSIRVAEVEKTWEEGKFLIFDDSFEHEVWHNGTGIRLVLIVDVWHPELTESQRNNLSPI